MENMFLWYALLMGIFITFLYDMIRVFRRVIPHNLFAISLEDLLFWIYCAVRVFLLMYNESDGTLRWFAILGAFTGMFLYRKTVSPYLVKYLSLLLKKILGWVGKALSFVCRPLLFLVHKGRGLLRRMSSAMRRRRRDTVWLAKKKLTLIKKVLKIKV